MKTNTDGEFGETAGAWLDGTGDEGTKRVLAEQLREPGRVEEFAGLCRVEALLSGAGRTEGDRRAALGAMVGRSWWRGRAREWVRRPVVWRVAAALAVCGLIGWAMWPEEGAGVAGRLVGKRPVVVASPIGQGGAVKAESVREMGEGMERELRVRYVKVALRGPLEDAVRLLSRALALPGGKVPEVEVRDGGDAQVMLNLPVALPAWTLLEMMAVQTGTVFAMEGDVLVFAKAEKAEEEREVAEDKDGLELPGGSLQGLALLLTGTPLRSGDPDELNVRLATRGTAPIGAGALQVGRVGERVTVSGPVRTLRALEMARRGMESRALVVSVETSVLRVGKDVVRPGGGQGWEEGGDEGRLKVDGTLGGAEYGKAMEKLVGEEGVTTMAAPGMVVRLFQSAMVMVGNRRVAMVAVPMGQDRVALHLGMDESEPGGPDMPEYEVVVELGSGMGGLLRRAEEGGEGLDCVGVMPRLKDAAWEEPVFELPRGIAADRAGMVHSPYAFGEGFVDVEGLKSGTKVKCPYSGLTFLVP